MARKKMRTNVLDPEQLLSFRRSSSPAVDDVFKKQIKIINEHLKRHEDLMFSDVHWDVERNTGIYSGSLAKEAKELAQCVANLGSLFLRIQKEAKVAASQLTFEEKCETIADFIRTLGNQQAVRFLERVYPAIYEVEQRTSKARIQRAEQNAKESARAGDESSED